jgi:serine/threonine-protein kinase
VVHRGIKPDNVMLRGRHNLTSAGVALGTPVYLAPEQGAADPQIDHRADLYSVGVMAYEMLTGGRRSPRPRRNRWSPPM